MEVDAQSRGAKGRQRRQCNKPNNEIAFYKTETEKLMRIFAATRCKVAFPPDGIELEKKEMDRNREKERTRRSKKDPDKRERGRDAMRVSIMRCRFDIV